MSWLTTLWCQDLLFDADLTPHAPTRPRELNLRAFTKLRNLRALCLHSARPFTHPTFSLLSSHTGAREQAILPPTLRTLVLHSFDNGPRSFDDDDDDDDDEVEGSSGITHKEVPDDRVAVLWRCRFLARLPQLASLAIGRCDAWTAGVWTECLAACAGTVGYLSLTGWARGADATRESAVERCLAGMQALRELELIDFWVDEGCVRGVAGLGGKLERLTVTVMKGVEEYGGPGWEGCGGDVVGLVNAACGRDDDGNGDTGGGGALREFVWNLPFELRDDGCVAWMDAVRGRIRKGSEDGFAVTFGFQ
ncbi:hypothetical protein BC938DRAFT_480758 [Jimgerdemannia flammicorona]|uniref:F-box domain-containing protein n=1 Tax=Jimgerdemannia flammicorona TaxID=994334 RepID=A0A433QHN5_9FUNG|nr:hypothetical protein BC938DRAFT_480758 [Jimgerdemannia flammicorona]